MSDEIGNAILAELKKQTSALTNIFDVIESKDFPDATSDVDTLVRINKKMLERMEKIEKILDNIESNTGQ